MAVSFVLKGEPVVSAIDQVPAGIRPSFLQPIHVGKFTILPDIDVSQYGEKQKFLIHLFKPYWFHVVSSEGPLLKLQTQSGTVFDTPTTGSVHKNYMVVVGPSDSKEPSLEVIEAVRSFVKT